MTELEKARSMAIEILDAGMMEGFITPDHYEVASRKVDRAQNLSEVDNALAPLASQVPHESYTTQALIPMGSKIMTTLSEQAWLMTDGKVPEKVFTVLGSAHLDFTRLSAGSEVRIPCTTILSELKLTVNSETEVISQINAVMAEVKLTPRPVQPKSVIILEGFALMAEVRVRAR